MNKVLSPIATLAIVAGLAVAATPNALACSGCGCQASAAPADNTAATSTTTPNIVETAVAADDFNTLVAAVQAAGLAEALQGEGPYTVFAPTDEAFAALPAGTLDSLLANPEQLSQILLYHVVEGKVKAADVVQLDSATTLQGQDVAISVEGETVRINGATVVAADVEASNGVIHVIDQVILPPQATGAGK